MNQEKPILFTDDERYAIADLEVEKAAYLIVMHPLIEPLSRTDKIRLWWRRLRRKFLG